MLKLSLLLLILFQCLLISCTNSAPSRIIGWGDSMMSGTRVERSILEIISDSLGGIPVKNFGVGGSQSKHAAVLQGAEVLKLQLKNNRIPEQGSVRITAMNIEPFNFQTVKQYRAGSIRGVDGFLRRHWDSSNPKATTYFEFERTAKGEAVVVKDTIVFYFEDAKHNKNDIVLIWVGRNDNFIDGDIKTSHDLILKMVNQLKSQGVPNYYVISLCNGNSDKEGLGSRGHTNFTNLNKALQLSFGNQFIDLRTYMVQKAIYDLKIEPSEIDLQDMQADAIPRRFLQDHVHFNQLGTDVAAKFIVNRISNL